MWYLKKNQDPIFRAWTVAIVFIRRKTRIPSNKTSNTCFSEEGPHLKLPYRLSTFTNNEANFGSWDVYLHYSTTLSHTVHAAAAATTSSHVCSSLSSINNLLKGLLTLPKKKKKKHSTSYLNCHLFFFCSKDYRKLKQ